MHYIAYQSNEIGRRTKHPKLIPLPTDSLGGFGMMVHCARCGLGVAISATPKVVAYEFKPGLTLADLCPFIIGLPESEKAKPREDACPYLAKSIHERIKELSDGQH